MVREAGFCADGKPPKGPGARHQRCLSTRLRVQRLSDVSTRQDGQEPWLTAPICPSAGLLPGHRVGLSVPMGCPYEALTYPYSASLLPDRAAWQSQKRAPWPGAVKSWDD